MATLYLRPASDVSIGHSCSSGSTGYNLINEVVCDEDSTYISGSNSSSSSSSNYSSSFNCIGSFTSGSTISSAKAVVYYKVTDTSISTSTIAVTVGSSSSSQSGKSGSYVALEYSINASDLTVSGNSVSAQITIASEVYSGDKDTSRAQRISQVYIQVEYTEPTIKSFSWIKLDGTWKKCKSFWIKQNGTWVKQTTPPTSYNFIERKHNPWTFDKSFRQASIVDDTTWLISDYIAVTPDVELIVTGQGGDTNNTMWQAYYADKTYYDYWGGSGTVITTYGGRNVYQRTLSATNMANTHWVRVGAFKGAYNYIKVEQNRIVLFDGSQYPYN